MLEQLLGSVIGGQRDGGLFTETREALIGGCWGLLMSGGFLFFFFMAALAWAFGVQDVPFAISGAASPFIALLCVSALLSPFIGVLFGAQGGMYSATRHIGCFGIYIAVLIAGILIISYGFGGGQLPEIPNISG